MAQPKGFIEVRRELDGKRVLFNIANITKIVACGGNSPRCYIYSNDGHDRVDVCETAEVVEQLIIDQQERV